MRKNVIYLMGCAAVMILAASCAGRSKDSTAQKTVPEFVLTYAENQAEDYPTTRELINLRSWYMKRPEAGWRYRSMPAVFSETRKR